ncbi:helix-turn-helix transcriptional regulator [Vallitalea guaymasensis]|uniref:helix-turn-helix transcriptional regulator n=1 Tax=Vallitalea guaymasensis TaxID=1185412 RepID=UPI00187D3F05|nr:helix-turn-helix transcriptional regulator [Vallitalea guaymasensis]
MVKDKIVELVYSKELFFKILSRFMLLIILPTLTMGIFFYKNMTIRSEQEQRDLNRKALDLVQKNMDEVLDNAEYKMLTLALNNSVLEFFREDISDTKQLLIVKDIRNLLDTGVYHSYIMDSIYIYNVRNNKIITNEAYEGLENFNDKNFLIGLRNDGASTIRTIKNKKIVTWYMKIPLNSSRPEGYIVYNSSVEKLTNVLKNRLYIDKINLALIDIHTGKVIVSTEDDFTEEVINIKALEEGKTTKFKDNILFNKISNKDGYAYVAIMPKSYLDNLSRPILYTVLSISLILLLVGVLISIYLSRQLYNPIETLVYSIRKDISKINNVPASNIRSEVEYINYAMKQYKTTSYKTKHMLRKNKDMIKNSVFNRLFNKEYIHYSDIKSNLEVLDINFSKNNYCLFAVYLENGIANSEIDIVDRFAVINIAEEILNKNNITAVGVDSDQKKVIIVLNFDSVSDDYNILKESAVELKRVIYEFSGISISIGIGDIVNELLDICLSYTSSLRALNYNVITEKHSIVTHEELNLNRGNYYPLRDIEKISNNIMIGKKDIVEIMLRDVFDDIRQNVMSLQNVKFCTIQMIAIVYKDMIDKGLDFNSFVEHEIDIFNEMDNMKTVNQIEEWLIGLVVEVTDYYQRLSGKSNDAIIDKVLKYVEDNYTKPIYLSNLADELNITQQHLSRKFKKHRGITLVAYINRLRIQKSAELLKTTDKNIGTIAIEVGFNDTKYFIKKFKEAYGITPNMYRNS